ncbi:MAG: TIGR00282 family metallophosphoesterase [Patescibacteria group bacterium]|nr:TIGR00282 family metallophosphoesterase [Patescibacteria group bacterium]
MKILFLGDIVGRPGRESVAKILPRLIKRYHPDITIANAENIAHGKGVTESSLQELMKIGIDFFTSGNHVWKKEGIKLLQDKSIPLIRPANYPSGVIGRGYEIINIRTQKIAIINLIGRVFFHSDYDCPFKKADEILAEIAREKCDTIFIDFHSEATSEARALGFYLDGKISAIVGTHTHVQTSDEQLLSKKTAYITDVGMCGVKDSVLGKNKEEVIEGFLKQDSVGSDWYNDWKKCIIQGVFIETGKDRKAKKIERVLEIVENK